jgi:hypothetical protein
MVTLENQHLAKRKEYGVRRLEAGGAVPSFMAILAIRWARRGISCWLDRARSEVRRQSWRPSIEERWPSDWQNCDPQLLGIQNHPHELPTMPKPFLPRRGDWYGGVVRGALILQVKNALS